MTNAELCVLCKGGRELCGKSPCPLIRRVEAAMPRTVHSSKEIFGLSPPSVFVGRYGYPRVSAGPMLPSGEVEDPARLANPAEWLGLSVEELVALRSTLMRPVASVDVLKPIYSGSVIDAAGELALSSSPVDTEVLLERPPRSSRTSLDIFEAPMGPSAPAVKARIVDNIVVPRRVDYIVGDTALGAGEGVMDLYKHGIPEEHIQRLFSTGQLGLARRRRMVPTRWTITGVQDIVAKHMMDSVLTYQVMDGPLLYSHTLLGNRFRIILAPRVWSFEMVETWLKGAFWGSIPRPFSDHETHRGRSTYASNITGAYYAARLSVLEHMEGLRRQATCIVYREITSQYWAPLGVWVIREGVRETLRSPPQAFDTMDDALKAAGSGVDARDWHSSSVLLRNIRSQRTLEDF